MSFESKMKKRGNKKLNQFAKNPYRKPWFSRIPIWTKVLVPSALAAGLIIGVFVGVLPNMTSKGTAHLKVDDEGFNNNAPASITPASEPGKGDYSRAPTDASAPSSAAQGMTSQNSASSLAPADSWEELSAPEKYRHLTYDDYRYYYNNAIPAIDVENVGELLNVDATIKGGNYVDGDFEKSTDAFSIYQVKNFASRIVVAVKFDEEENYYPYFYNTSYKTFSYSTLEELFNDIPLNIVSSTNEAYFECFEEGYELFGRYSYTGIEKDQVMSIVFNDLTVLSESNANYPKELVKNTPYHKSITVATNFPSLHIGISMPLSSGVTLYDNGCLTTTIFNNQQTFYVGTGVYQTFEAYLFNNFTGTKIN